MTRDCVLWGRSAKAVVCLALGGLLSAAQAADAPSAGRTTTVGAAMPPSPQDCVSGAASYHGVNSWILRAILKVESNFKPDVVTRNKNGTLDVGVAQINSIHFPRLRSMGVHPAELFDPCKASYVAAWHLKQQMDRFGNTWFAVGAYHSTTDCFNRRYVAMVRNALIDMRAKSGVKEKVPAIQSCAKKKQGANVASVVVPSLLALDLE